MVNISIPKYIQGVKYYSGENTSIYQKLSETTDKVYGQCFQNSNFGYKLVNLFVFENIIISLKLTVLCSYLLSGF